MSCENVPVRSGPIVCPPVLLLAALCRRPTGLCVLWNENCASWSKKRWICLFKYACWHLCNFMEWYATFLLQPSSPDWERAAQTPTSHTSTAGANGDEQMVLILELSVSGCWTNFFWSELKCPDMLQTIPTSPTFLQIAVMTSKLWGNGEKKITYIQKIH